MYSNMERYLECIILVHIYKYYEEGIDQYVLDILFRII